MFQFLTKLKMGLQANAIPMQEQKSLYMTPQITINDLNDKTIIPPEYFLHHSEKTNIEK